MKKQKYHYFYKITNLINNHFYYGVHSTYNLDDGYMGSGKRLHHAYEKYGIENFKKEILNFFNSKKDAYKYESEMVTEDLVNDPNCYNLMQGGIGWSTKGLTTVKDKFGNSFMVSITDPRYLSGELVGIVKNKVTVFDNIKNEYVNISTEEYHKNKDKYTHPLSNHRQVIDITTNEKKLVSLDEFENNDKYISVFKNKVNVKDKTGKMFRVDINDPRYLSGELKPIWSGKKHKPETKEKWKETYKKIKHQQGEKNSQFGTCWIHNNKENKKIKKEELENYINDGWIKGRKMKF